MTIEPDMAAFLQEGLPIHIATRNADLQPSGARVTAVKVHADHQHIVAFVPKVSAAPILADLAANGQVALGFVRPADVRACQVKGVFVESRAVTARERAFVMEQYERRHASLEVVGYPRAGTTKWRMWPCVAVRLRVTALFSQTPGPGAGAPLR